MFSPPNQNIEGACDQITLLIIHLITAKKMIILSHFYLYPRLWYFYPTVSFKFRLKILRVVFAVPWMGYRPVAGWV